MPWSGAATARKSPRRPQKRAVAVIIAVLLTAAAAVAWAYILLGRGQSWRTDQRLPGSHGSAGGQAPSITVIIPARDEAAVLPSTLPTLLDQAYPGSLRLVLVDDESSDDTAAIATELGKSAGWVVSHDATAPHAADRELLVMSGQPLPAGWAGKVWAMSQGLQAHSDSDYVLFTDADVAYAPGTVTTLARAATQNDLALVSQMALLRAKTAWERFLIPAFVYFFAQLYPFRLVNRQASRTAAAAGGCMLVNRAALDHAGGLNQIRSARIDDVALGKLLKRSGASCWLGLTSEVISTREYPRLGGVWGMVARSAFTQLRYSWLTLIAVLLGLSWLYLLPPVAAMIGLAALATGTEPTAAWLLAAGASGWVIMSGTYLPILSFYRLSPLRAPTLPLIAALYAAMTADSARRHLAGRGGAWKGRTISR